MRLGLISDVHASVNPLREALELFAREGVDEVFCAGDLAGYGDELAATVKLLRESGCRVVLGNHDLWFRKSGANNRSDAQVVSYLDALPASYQTVIEEQRLYLVHASPPASLLGGIRLLDEKGAVIPAQLRFWRESLADYPAEVLVIGHTHQVFAERLGHPLVVNPGSTRFNHTCAILELPSLTVRFFALSGREPILSWNWGLEGRYPG